MSLKNFNLNNKYALITGAGGLLGFEHAQALLEVGCKLVLTDLNISKLKKKVNKLSSKYNSKILIFKMDVTNINDINAVKKNLKESKIRIDILINNATIDPKYTIINKSTQSSRLENFRLDQWNIEISVGLTGAFLCSQVFGSLMAKDKKGGVILNIASDLSVISPDQRLYRKKNTPKLKQNVKPITYSVIKTGLIGMTRYLSTYWSEEGVRCNALSPGGIKTNQDPEFIKKLTNLIPQKRMAKKNEYRSAVQFLCSDASKYLNGQNIVMDGGRSVL